jgi:hypothetical protein
MKKERLDVSGFFLCMLRFRTIVDALPRSAGRASQASGRGCFFVPLESADKTAIYNLIRLVSSTVNGRPSFLSEGLLIPCEFPLRRVGDGRTCVSSLMEGVSSILLIDLAKRTD